MNNTPTTKATVYQLKYNGSARVKGTVEFRRVLFRVIVKQSWSVICSKGERGNANYGQYGQ